MSKKTNLAFEKQFLYSFWLQPEDGCIKIKAKSLSSALKKLEMVACDPENNDEDWISNLSGLFNCQDWVTSKNSKAGLSSRVTIATAKTHPAFKDPIATELSHGLKTYALNKPRVLERINLLAKLSGVFYG